MFCFWSLWPNNEKLKTKNELMRYIRQKSQNFEDLSFLKLLKS